MESILPIVYKAIAVAGLLVTIGSVAWMAITLRRPRPMKAWSPLISLAIVPLSLIVYAYFVSNRLVAIIAFPLLLIGFLLGIFWGRSTELRVVNGRIIGQRTIFYLVLWGLSYAITQSLATLASAKLVTAGLTTMFFTSGATVGTNGNLFIRLLATKWRMWRGTLPVETQVICLSCRKTNPPEKKFCVYCGAQLALAQAQKGGAK